MGRYGVRNIPVKALSNLLIKPRIRKSIVCSYIW